MENNLAMKRMDERHVEDDIIIFLSVYKAPPYDYVHQFLGISKKKLIDHILWMLVCHENEGEDVKEISKIIESILKSNHEISINLTIQTL